MAKRSRRTRRKFARNERIARSAMDGFISSILYKETAWRGNPYRHEWQAHYLQRYIVAKRECARMLADTP